MPKVPTAPSKARKSTARATKHAISKTLKVHRWQLDQFLAKTGAPTPDAARTYDVAEVAAFISTLRSTDSLDDLRAARLEEVKLKCARLKVELEKDEGLWVRKSDIDLLHGKLALNLKGLLYAKLTEELPSKCQGYDALALRRAGREMADDLVSRLAQDIDTWVPSS
jgi:glutathione synthase/RimK-type ligase-like ATP-grasp enzyme